MNINEAGRPLQVIFDMDGIIFDTERFYLDCCVPAAEKLGLSGMYEVALGCIGLTAQETEKRLIEAYGEEAPLEQFHQETFRIFRQRYDAEGLPVKPGARQILSWLREEGAKVALASSTETEVVRMELKDAGLIDYFDVIIGGDMAKRSKPAPDIFLQAAESLGADPSDCFIIEDSFNGIRAAFASGGRPLMVPDILEPTEEIRAMAEHVLPSLHEVLRLFLITEKRRRQMDLLELMRCRRSIRKFTEEAIPEEKLEKVLQAALLAPTSMGKRPWKFQVIKSRSVLEQLSRAKAHGAGLLAGCNTAVAVFADSDLSDAWIEDSSIALAYMDLMAAEQGLGSCWVQMRMRKDEKGNDAEQKARDILGVELPWRMVGIMALGMPDEKKAPYELSDLLWDKVIR